MKNFKQFAVVAILVTLACAGLHAQTFDVRVTIPFDFRAADTQLPAGEYVVHGEGSWVVLRALDGTRRTPILTTIAAAGGYPKDAGLDFNRYGSEYFLSVIWDSSSWNGHQLLPTAREKEVAKRRGRPVPTAVTLDSSK